MQKLVPVIYYYIVSLIGLVLLIIGIFADVHYLTNILSGPQYPLPYSTQDRCAVPPAPLPADKQAVSPQQPNDLCLKSIEEDRRNTQRSDAEKAISFTLIGALVFGIHFYFARKTSSSQK